MIGSLAFRHSLQSRPTMRPTPPPGSTEFECQLNLESAVFHRKWLTHPVRLGYLLTHPESFYHQSAGFTSRKVSFLALMLDFGQYFSMSPSIV